MQELFFTIMTIWLIYRIFGDRPSESSRAPRREQHEPRHSPVSGRPKVGDYVDYEEVG